MAVDKVLSKYLTSTQDHGNGYEWSHFGQLSFGGREASLSACYFRGSLRELRWSVNLLGNTEDKSWHTLEECEQEVEFVRAALRTTLGRAFSNGLETFVWGEVWSQYNDRDGFVSSGLRYR